MKTEFLDSLKGKELTDDIIRQIQAESGKDVTAAKNQLQTQIDTLTANNAELQSQLDTKTQDIANIQQQLTEAQGSKTKMNELQQSLTDLQNQYNTDKTNWQAKLDKQQYDFLAKETMNGIKFSSNAAKDNFYQKLIEKNLPIENQKLLGFEDYLAAIKEQDPGAFVNDDPKPDPPKFTGGGGDGGDPPAGGDDKSIFGFNFIGVRKHE